MSYKFYGRLIGKISTSDVALGLTTPADTTTPFNEQAPGTKFMAYGEDSTSLAFNRALGALATNIDHVAGILGTPALRSEIIGPRHSDGSGWSALTLGEEEFKSKTLHLGSGIGENTEPPVWLYCGLTKEDLGQNNKIFRVETNSSSTPDNASYKYDSDYAFTNQNVSATDCRERTGGSSIFESATIPAGSRYPQNTKNGVPLFIPPVRRIRSDISPYNGTQKAININCWDTDGIYLKDITPSELFLRPGCFVEVFNNGDSEDHQGNNGLFRIESIVEDSKKVGPNKGSKIVLSRGNLHRITVAEGPFNEGELIGWKSHDNDSDSLGAGDGVTHLAHIAYVVDRLDISPTAQDLYITDISGPNVFNNGTNGKLGGFPHIASYGSLGEAAQEEDATQNSNLLEGKYIFNALSVFANDDTIAEAHKSTVIQTLPANYPVVFSTINIPGKIYPCAPQGFLLNPILEFPLLLPGNNHLLAKTLTTVGEQLKSNAGGWSWKSAEDASSEPYQTRQDVIATETLLDHIHHGRRPIPGKADAQINGAKSPTQNILGPNLWHVSIAQGAGPDSLSDEINAAGLELGKDDVVFTTSTGDLAAIARIVDHWFVTDTGVSHLVLSDLHMVRAFASSYFTADLPMRPGAETWRLTMGAYHGDVVELIEAPYLSDEEHYIVSNKGDNNSNLFFSEGGLNAAFHMQNSSGGTVRGKVSGFGNTIYVPGGIRQVQGLINHHSPHRPFTTVLEALDDNHPEIGHLVVSNAPEAELITFQNDASDVTNPWNYKKASVRYESENLGEGSLVLQDANTLRASLLPVGRGSSGLPLSSGHVGALNGQHGTIQVSHQFDAIPRELGNVGIDGAVDESTLRVSLMQVLERLTHGNISNFWTAQEPAGLEWDGEYDFSAYSSGVFTGLDILKDNPDQIVIRSGYVYCAGAKKYVEGRTIGSLKARGDWTANSTFLVLYRNTDDSTVKIDPSEPEVEGPLLIRKIADIDAWGKASNKDIGRGYGIGAIPLAVIETDAGEDIASITDVRTRVSRLDQRDEIYVGDVSNGDFGVIDAHWDKYSQSGMHFPSIGAAMAAIRVWDSIDADAGGRKWTIKVVGKTLEQSDPERGIELPIKIPTDSMSIEGLGGRDRAVNSDLDGAKTPTVEVVTTAEGCGFIDLNSASNITISNLHIRFREGGWEQDPAIQSTTPIVNAFSNSKSDRWTNDVSNAGGSYGRYLGGTYGGRDNEALQKNIKIERVHVSGLHHCFFFAGREDGIAAGNAGTGRDVPFDNLIIKDCVNHDSIWGFVNIGPQNSLLTRDATAHADDHTNGQAHDAAYPVYWRGIQILNCKSSRAEALYDLDDLGLTNYELEPSLYGDAVYLAACKEVVVRDCVFERHLKGITFGVGNWTHYCSGTIEGNSIHGTQSDGITAFSDSDISGISILNNKVYDWGSLWVWNDAGVAEYRETRVDVGNDKHSNYAAIRVAGQEITISGNSFINNRDDESLNGDDYVLPCSGIYISRDLEGSQFAGANPEAVISYLWGVKIVNNSMKYRRPGYEFIYSDVPAIGGLVISGNTQNQISGDLFYPATEAHPMWFNVDGDPSNWGAYLDSGALNLDITLEDATITGNVFGGHAILGASTNVTVSDNQFTLPTTMVAVNGGQNLTFNGNIVNNGTLYYSGGFVTAVGNNFCFRDDTEEYPDYEDCKTETGFNMPRPGIKISLEDTISRPIPGAIISGNSVCSTPSIAIMKDGTEQLNSALLGRYCLIEVASAPVSSSVNISNNVLEDDGLITTRGGCDTNITGNTVVSKYGFEVLTIYGHTHPTDWGDVATGKYTGKTSISGNVLGGTVWINGCNEEFGDWDDIVDAMMTNTRPGGGTGVWPFDGSEWGRLDPTDTPGAPEPYASEDYGPYMHNRLSNVSISDNTILGNVTLLALQDSNFTNNRMPGLIDTGHHAFNTGSDHTAMTHLTMTRNIFTAGQLEMASCKRMHVMNCRLASSFMFLSSMIKVSNCTFVHNETDYDLYGSYKLKTIGTYAPANQGRAFTGYCNHISFDNCILSDATLDDPPDTVNANGGALTYSNQQWKNRSYMNNYRAAIYSSVPVSTNHAYNARVYERTQDTVGTEFWSRSDKYLWAFQGDCSHAISITNCHLSRAYFTACDDAKISGNRFYYGGIQPLNNTNLLMNNNSLRPCINDNHFTSCVELGDVGTFDEHWVESNIEGAPIYKIHLENVTRHPIHAQVTNNRFDSPVGPGFNNWERPDGNYEHRRGGSGDLTIHNYGGSLISGNHMIHGPYGFLVHSARTAFTRQDTHECPWYHDDFFDDWSLIQSFMYDKIDGLNRMGGSIKLDPSHSYPPDYYTMGHLAWGDIEGTDRPAEEDYLEAWHRIKVGTGIPNGRYLDGYEPDYDHASADYHRHSDAPMPWRGIMTDMDEADGDIKTSNVKYRWWPWGGVEVFNWWYTAHSMHLDAYRLFDSATTDNQILVSVRYHYPKTLGAFVIGNSCKDVEMDDRLRNMSWAYGRHCDIRVDMHGQPHLPAQAFETPINPMHATNHANFNMLRHKSEHIDLAIYGNFGQYVIRSNYDLDRSHGIRRADGQVSEARLSTGIMEGTLDIEYGDFFPCEETRTYTYCRIGGPAKPDDHFMYGLNPLDLTHCDPFFYWKNHMPPIGASGNESEGEEHDDGTSTGTTTSCVLAGTMIETERGNLPVEEVQVGDLVRSYDFDTSEFGYYEVISLMEPAKQNRWVLVTTTTGYELRCSDTHPLYTLAVENNELPVNEASVGDTVYVVDGSDLIEDTIAEIGIVEETVTVFNFEVDAVRSYISDGILSHNKTTRAPETLPPEDIIIKEIGPLTMETPEGDEAPTDPDGFHLDGDDTPP